MSAQRADVTVVGGGVSGLTAAFWLRQGGATVQLLERESRVGGTMRTVRDGGWLVEQGPNSALETTPLFGEMFAALGIGGEVAYADPSADRRYVLRDGVLHAIPMSPGAFLRTRLWSTRGKLRLLGEPFVGRAAREESIAEFVERRLGREILDYAINPFVAGVYAGSPEGLSVRAAFPKLYALEERYGGLIRGMVLGARERRRRAETAKDRARMFSFRDGMQTFPDALARSLGGAVLTGAEAVGFARTAGGRYEVRATVGGAGRLFESAGLVLAVPAAAAAALLAPHARGLAERLAAVAYPPVAEVFLGFRAEQFARPLDGFGYLVPARERRNVLGTIWSSSLFPGRAPAGHVALTTFVGGTRQPEMASKGDDELVRLTVADIHDIMGGRGAPAYARIVRWERAIPQYTLGYGAVLGAIEDFERAHPGLAVCSNFRGGIAVGDCVMSGERTAARLRAALAARSGEGQQGTG